MIFSELYSAYYNTVACVLKAAVEHPLQKNELQQIIENNAFVESILNIEPAITEERWQFILPDGTTPVKYTPTMPLTLLEKRWLKSIYADPRIKLFTDEIPKLADVEPLFTENDISVFDKYSDGDPFTDGNYIKNFRLILDAVKNRYPLSIEAVNRKGKTNRFILMPEYLEYSEKDDKFRLIGSGSRYGRTVNAAGIIKCEKYNKTFKLSESTKIHPEIRTVEFELVDERNALERVLMHFAHFEKQAERIEDDRYRVKLNYNREDETEMVIRILSFGPMLKVTAPEHFRKLIIDRLLMQKSCGQ